jgi:hypothetical protein
MRLLDDFGCTGDEAASRHKGGSYRTKKGGVNMGIPRIFSRILGRGRSRRPPEAYIISYPKSGRTWLRLLLGKVLCDQFGVEPTQMLDTLRATCLAGVTPTKFTHDGSGMREGLHFSKLSACKAHYEGKRVVLLLRDPRDVMVSCYFQATKRINVFDGSIADFVRNEQYGIRKCVSFYKNWGENVRVPRETLCLRYEEIHAGPQRVLQSLLNFIGVRGVSSQTLDAAIEFGRFENMKRMEATGQFNRQVLRPGDAKDDESFKVRRGKVGGYSNYLSQDDCKYLTEVIAEARCPLLDPYVQDGIKKVA